MERGPAVGVGLTVAALELPSPHRILPAIEPPMAEVSIDWLREKACPSAVKANRSASRSIRKDRLHSFESGLEIRFDLRSTMFARSLFGI